MDEANLPREPSARPRTKADRSRAPASPGRPLGASAPASRLNRGTRPAPHSEDDRPEDQPSADPRVVGRRHDFLRYLEVIEAKADDIGTDHDQEDERRDDHRSGEALDDAAPRETATGAADHRCRDRADSAGLGRHDEDSIDGSLTAVGEDNALRN